MPTLKTIDFSKKRVCKCCGRELPLTRFHATKIGVMKTCKDCVKKHQIEGHAKKKMADLKDEEVAKARKARLSEFTPRELMERLKELGYKFTMTYTEVHYIDSEKL